MQPGLIAMLVGLGFALAALAMLLAGRMLWLGLDRARRSKARRDLPVEMTRLQSERDRLKAENAMLTRKLEVREKELKSRLAERMSELARFRNRLDQATAENRRLRQALPDREPESQAAGPRKPSGK